MQRYPYRIRPVVMVLCTVLLAAFAWLASGQAQHNDRGLTINGIIHLTAPQATIFYWAAAILCAVLIPWGVMVLLQGSKRAVIVGPESVIIPKHAGTLATHTIRYADISGMSLQKVKTHRVLHIQFKGGSVKLWDSALPNKRDFDAIIEVLQARRAGGAAGQA